MLGNYFSIVLRIAWLHGVWWFGPVASQLSPASPENCFRTPCNSFVGSPKLATGMQRGLSACHSAGNLDPKLAVVVRDVCVFLMISMSIWDAYPNWLSIIGMGWTNNKVSAKPQTPVGWWWYMGLRQLVLLWGLVDDSYANISGPGSMDLFTCSCVGRRKTTHTPPLMLAHM